MYITDKECENRINIKKWYFPIVLFILTCGMMASGVNVFATHQMIQKIK